MKVCFFTKEYPPNIYGGAGVHVDYLSRELAQLLSLHVKYFGEKSFIKDNLKVEGIQIDSRELSNIPEELSGVFSAFFKNLTFFNSDFNPDIVHCHTWYSYLAGIIAKLGFGIPLVTTVHSLEPLRPWKKEQIGKGYNLSSWIESQALQMADAIIAVSEGTKQDILKHFNVAESKIHIIPNGIDCDEYHPVENKEALTKYNIDLNKPYLLFVGRITMQKGIIHLVDAIPYIDPEIQIVLCAGAPDTDAIRKEMENHIAKAKISRNNIVWISDMVSNEDKIQLYSHAHLFCCPSIYEPFGIINLEAMACRTPVVGSKTGGIPEIIIDGETGVLVPIDINQDNTLMNPDKFSKDLASSINKIIKDDKLRESMSQKSMERAVSVYSWKKIANEIFNIYKTLLKS